MDDTTILYDRLSAKIKLSLIALSQQLFPIQISDYIVTLRHIF